MKPKAPQPKLFEADTNASLTDAIKPNDRTRDGAEKLAGERKRGNLAFRRRNRAGANWVPHDRRV